MPYSEDMTDDVGRNQWLPPEGLVDVEIVKMVEGISNTNNSKFTIDFASADDPTQGLQQDLTNIQGKRWLLRQLLEACGIEPKENEEGRKIYNWDISDIEGRTVSAKVQHESNNWIDRKNVEHHDKRAKFTEFKKLTVK